MENDLTEEERENMRKLAALKGVVLGIAAKWTWLFVLTFAFTWCAAMAYLVYKSVRNPQRYTAKTQLMYIPRGGRVASLGEKQLFRVLDRGSLKKRVGEHLLLPGEESETLGADLEVVQEARPSNLYTLTAHSGARVSAIRKVNAYAAVLIAEYGSYRARELERWSGLATDRQTEWRNEIANIEAEEAMLAGQCGTEAPIEALSAINGLLGDQRRNKLLLEVDISTEEAKRKQYQEELGEAGTAILTRTKDIRKLSESIDLLDAELAKLREVYTDLNPKVKGKLEDREALTSQYMSILAEFGLAEAGPGKLEAAERAATGLVESAARLEALKDALFKLDDSMGANEERAAVLTRVAPRMSQLRAQRQGLEKSLRELDEELESTGSQQATAESDLQQLEPASAAWDKGPLSAENFVMAVVAGGGCTGAAVVAVVLLGLLFGRVRGAEELAVQGDIRVLGSLPRRWAMGKKAEKEALEVVALHFVGAPETKGTILVCRLKGASKQPKFMAALDWSLSMAGLRAFKLNIVPQGKGEIPQEGTETMLNTVRKGEEGWFPAVNRFSLAPTELEMLKADLSALRAEYDCVFMMTPEGLRHGGDFTRQLLGVCDSALLMAGANKTRRRELSYARRLVLAAGKPMTGIVTGAKGRVVRREMEASKW